MRPLYFCSPLGWISLDILLKVLYRCIGYFRQILAIFDIIAHLILASIQYTHCKYFITECLPRLHLANFGTGKALLHDHRETFINRMRKRGKKPLRLSYTTCTQHWNLSYPGSTSSWFAVAKVTVTCWNCYNLCYEYNKILITLPSPGTLPTFQLMSTPPVQEPIFQLL